jgi:hypothetical protein
MWSNATTISPVEKIGLMPELDGREEIRLLSEGVSSRFQCNSYQDWRFGEIEADARRRSGHNYRGMLHKSVADCAAWLQESLRKRCRNKYDLARPRWPHHKTVQKILDGFRVGEGVLEKVVQGLSNFKSVSNPLPPVTALDYPALFPMYLMLATLHERQLG